MQTRAKSLCDVDDTWEDALGEFKSFLKDKATWGCYCIEGVDKEAILSAPEAMDPKTDSGVGYEKVSSLQHMLDAKEIPSSATLADEAALLDAMDWIHAKELTYLEGYSLVQSYLAFPYFLRVDLLKKENPALHAYCRGVLRTLDCVLRAVLSATVRSEEEFMMAPQELDRQSECPLEEILAELETEAARAKSPAVAARLRWRKNFLSALSLFLEAKRRSDVDAACDLCTDALAMLESADFARTAEPAVDPKLVREKEMAFWVSTLTTTKEVPTPKFADAMAAYKTMLRQLASVKQLITLQSLPSLVDFVEALGAEEPLLPTRSLVVVVMFGRDAYESFLFGLPIQQRVLEMLAKDYGSPLYLKIFEGDDAMIESVVKYYIHKTADPLKITPEQLMYVRQQVVDAVRRWTAEASKHFLVHLETMLCSRGLAHRRLMKGMTGLAQFQEMSYTTDLSIFLAAQPGVTGETQNECIRASTVLALFASSFVLRAMEQIVQLYIELDLLSQGELVPALWYLHFTQRAQTENLAQLCLQNTSFIPETRINKKTRVPLYNLALSTRTKGNLDVTRVAVLEATRMLSDSVFLSACLLEHKKMIDLTSGAKHSLVTVEDTFNHRMQKCFGAVHNPPVTSYKRCMSAKLDFAGEEDKIGLYAKKAADVAINAATKMKAVLTRPAAAAAAGSSSASDDAIRCESLQQTYGSFEKAAKSVAASLNTFSALCEDAELMAKYTAHVDRSTVPHIVSFTLRKKD